MKIKRIHHIGVIVDDLAEATKLLEEGLGLKANPATPRADLRAAFFQCGDVSIEAIEVTDPASRSERLGQGQRARIEHIAIEVEDLDVALEALRALGVRPKAQPRLSNGYRSIWTDPATSDGVMYQFVQKAQDAKG